MVTEVDKEAQEMIIEDYLLILLKTFLWGEESNYPGRFFLTWVIDPIDVPVTTFIIYPFMVFLLLISEKGSR